MPVEQCKSLNPPPINWEEHKGLVYAIVRKMRIPWWKEEDAIQRGMVGLWVASTRFKPELGNAFSSYASSYVRGYILNQFREEDHKRRKYQIEVVSWPVEQESGEDVEFASDRDITYDETPVLDALKAISNRKHREMFYLRYFKGMSEKDLAEEYGMTIQGVSQALQRGRRLFKGKLVA